MNADEFIIESTWLDVQSSDVKRIKYNYDDQLLEIQFLDGNEYKYPNVTEEQARSLFTAKSKGTWVAENVRSKAR